MDVCVISKRVKGKSSSSLNDSTELQFGFIFISSFRSEIEFHQHALVRKVQVWHTGELQDMYERIMRATLNLLALPMECSKLEELPTLLHQGDKSRQVSGRGYRKLLCRQKG